MEKAGKQQAKRAAAHERICQATIKCLADIGYAETSIQRVIQEAGVSKGALQHHFPSKQDLMTATAERILANASMTPAAENIKPGGERNVRKEIERIWDRFVDTNAYRALLEILIAIRTDTELQARLSPLLKDWEKQRLKTTIMQYEAAGGDDTEVMILMTLTTSLMRGLIVQGEYNEDPDFNRKVVDYWLDIVEKRLRPRS